MVKQVKGTRAAWAERKARQVIETIQGGGYPSTKAPAAIADALLAEHKRAVRVVKAEITRVKLDQHTFRDGAKDSVLHELQYLLDKLQKGRT